MTENSNHPREGDLVLGGQNPAPTSGVVLGGLAGVQRRWTSDIVEQRVAVLKDALKYKQSGLELVIRALEDESDLVQRSAYILLREKKDSQVRQALQSFNFYQFFDCLSTVKGGEKIAISPDGQAIAYLRGKSIRVHNLHTNELFYTIDKHPRAHEFFIISNDGETLIRSINGSSKLIEVWQQGEKLFSRYGHDEEINAIAISPDNQTIATGSYDKTIKIWHLKTGKLLFTISNLLTWKTHKQAVLALAFSPNGQILISGSADSTIKVWNLLTRNLIRTYKLPSYNSVQSLIISPDGKAIASASYDRKIRLWHLGTDEVIRTLDEELDSVSCLAFSPNGRILASGNRNKTIKLWNTYTGELLRTLTGHENSVICLTFSWDGQNLVSGSEDRTIKVWGVGGKS